MSKVSLVIQYAGLSLLVAKNDTGEDVTPLKPISDLFGLKWENQRVKVTNSPFFSKYFGICTPLMGGADGQNREQTCILVSRVAAYLMTISPERVRANGNESGANYLEAKLNEWADALHDYEELGIAVKKNNHSSAQLELARINTSLRLISAKSRTASIVDRKTIESMQGVLAKHIGIPFQADLVEPS
jgi:hypothetical protein